VKIRGSQPKAWSVGCHVLSYRRAPAHSCMAGRLDPLIYVEYNNFNFDFFICVFSRILFDLILVHATTI
jgi:hypothetical protein